MSRYLVKQIFAVEAEEKRLIDTNEVLRHRMELEAQSLVETQSLSAPDGDGFIAGLNPEEVELPEDEDVALGNVIKAKEEADLVLEQAHADAQALLEQARTDAAGILEEARIQAENEKQKVLEQARQHGYEAGQAKAQAEADELRREYEDKVNQMEAAYQQQIDELEPKFIDAITAVYEHIFQVELGSQRGILEHLISNTMHRLEGSHNFLIHVSKDDYSYVNTQKKEILGGTVSGFDTVDVVEDITLGKNQCLIETDGGIFDCGLDTQLSELRRKLILLSWSGEG